MRAPAYGQLAGWLFLFLWLLLGVVPAEAQSRRVVRLWATLAAAPGPTIAREQALWALAWDKEVSPTQQDSLAACATRLAAQLHDSIGQWAGQVAHARMQLAQGQRTAARALLQPVLIQALRRSNAWLQLLALIQLGRSYWGTSQHARAQHYWQQAWAAAQRLPDPYWRARTAALRANCTPDYAQALAWYFRSLHLAEQADCQSCQAEVLGSISYTYQALGELDLAARYVTKALRQQQQQHNAEGEKLTLFILAGLHIHQGHYLAALADYRQVARLPHSLTDSLSIAAGRAEVYVAQRRYGLASTQARRGLALARQLGNLDLQTTLEATLAEAFLQVGQGDSALAYGHRSYAHRQRGAGYVMTARTCQVLAQAYATRGNFAQAYAFTQRAQVYADSLTNDKIRERVAQVREGYALAQHQHRIAQLERDQARDQLRRQQQLAASGLGGLLLLAAAGALLWGQRRRQTRRLAALRQRLAADLHDEVGALLLRVSLRTELLGNTGPATGAASVPQLAALRAESQQALATLRDVVWNLDAGADTVGALLDRLGEHLDQVAEPTGLQTEVTVRNLPAEQPLAPPLRQHLYLLGKEAISNAVRHARSAHHLHLTLHRTGASLLLVVTDDGQPLGSPAGRGGLGLRTMRQRAQAMGGLLTAGPRPDGKPGWQVQVRVPFV